MAEVLIERGALRGRRGQLLEQLKEKFSKVPKTVESLVRHTEDEAKLARWSTEDEAKLARWSHEPAGRLPGEHRGESAGRPVAGHVLGGRRRGQDRRRELQPLFACVPGRERDNTGGGQ
jgi:hypothetical protein